jgi:AraC-like DNA-binding protein
MDTASIEQLPMPITYGRHLLRQFNPEQLLAGTGLTPADLEDPGRHITVRQALQYIHNTIALAAEPHWYLSWASTLTDHFHGPISIALLSAPTLGDGIDAFLRYFPGRIPYMHMQGRQDGADFLAELCPLIELGIGKALLVETPLVILHQHLDTVYGVDFSQAHIRLDYQATLDAQHYERYFKCELRFDSSCNALVIPQGWRGLRNLGYSESTWAHAIEQCEATVSSSRERETLGDIRACLCHSFADAERQRPLPTLETIASKLHLAPRTLIRRLRRLGTSYQAITDEFLRTRAEELLHNNGITIKEVALSLGFDNPANFGKAFKRWCGVSPGQYRSSLSHGRRHVRS